MLFRSIEVYAPQKQLNELKVIGTSSWWEEMEGEGQWTEMFHDKSYTLFFFLTVGMYKMW